MNIDKYRVATNNTDYHIISKLIFIRIILPKSMEKKQSFFSYDQMNIDKYRVAANIIEYHIISD